MGRAGPLMKHTKLDADEDDEEGIELNDSSVPDDSTTVPSVDAYLSQIGEFGAYQRKHYAMIGTAWLPCAFCTLSMVFVNRAPEWLNPETGTIEETGLTTELCDSGLYTIENSFHSIRSEWGLYCADEWKAGALNSLFFVGYMFGAAYLGGKADQMGRPSLRPVLHHLRRLHFELRCCQQLATLCLPQDGRWFRCRRSRHCLLRLLL